MHLFFAAFHKFLILWFLLGYLFLLCNLLFWFRNKVIFLSKDHLSVAGRAHGWVDLTMSSVGPMPHLRGFVHLDVLNDQRIYISSLSSTLPSAFLSKGRRNLSTLFGPLALRPAPLFGPCTPTSSIIPTEWTHCFFKVTSFRFLGAFQICVPLMVGVRVFTSALKVNLKICMILWGFRINF